MGKNWRFLRASARDADASDVDLESASEGARRRGRRKEPEHLLEHALELGAADRPDEAERVALVAARHPEAGDVTRLRAANLLVNLARFDGIPEIVKSVGDTERNPAWRSALDHFSGMSAWATGDLVEGERLLRSAVELNPSDGLYLGRLIAFYAEYERFDDVRGLQERVGQVDDPSVPRQYLEQYGLSDDHSA